MQRPESPDYFMKSPFDEKKSIPESVVTKSMHDHSDPNNSEDPADLSQTLAENIMSNKIMSWCTSEEKLTIGMPRFNQIVDDDY
mmetsp:Transcript_18038/g.22584  ORF Transcript_18038/g.22584 Transcript_18038/m.22584 type:complete len:84 (-) Transcript_18038:219-470(-)